MAPLPDTGDLSLRYAPYIQELQEFFAIHDLRHGTPDDLTLLANRLGARGTFAPELASMVRSVIFRERGSIPHADALALVALASGGPNIEAYAYDLQPSLESLSGFLLSAARAPGEKASQPRPQQVRPPSSQPVPEPAQSTPFEYLPVQQVPLESRPFELEPSVPAPFVPEPIQSGAVDQGSVVARPAAVSDSLLPGPRQANFTTADPQRTSPTASRDSIPKTYRSLWIAGAVALPAILLAAFLLNHRSASPTPSPATHPASVVASAAPLPLPQPQTPLADAPASIATVPFQPVPSPISQLPAPIPTRIVSAPAVRSPSHISAVRPAPPPVRIAASSQRIANAQAATPTSTQSVARSESESAIPAAHSPAPSPDTVAAEVALAAIPKELSSISSGIMSSHLLASSQPEYPKLATLAHIEGSVILQAVVSKSGKVTAVHVLSGHRLLRTAATKAVRGWRYRPYLADGRPVDIATIITLDFKLRQ